jgi:hypothetical protein
MAGAICTSHVEVNTSPLFFATPPFFFFSFKRRVALISFPLTTAGRWGFGNALLRSVVCHPKHRGALDWLSHSSFNNNRKYFYSEILSAIVDPRGVFMSFDIGFP